MRTTRRPLRRGCNAASLRRGGARTLAQYEASSVVYGMPRAAADLGAAEQIVALPQMPGAILAHCIEQRMEVARK